MGVSYSLLIYIQAVQSLGEDKQQKRIIQRLFYMKQIYTFFAVTMMAVAMPKTANAYDFSAVAPSGQTLYYNISDSSVIVTFPGYWTNRYPDYAEKPTGNLIIPASVTYGGITYAVTGIEVRAFEDCTGLTSVTIPNSVTTIVT